MKIGQYQQWIDIRGWLLMLEELRSSEFGFSFTELPPYQKVKVVATNQTSYLRRSQKAEAESSAKRYEAFTKKWRAFNRGLDDYKKLGESFVGDILGSQLSAEDKQAHMRFSEKNEHLLHNAAVLWLEAQEQTGKDQNLDYEMALKTMWFNAIQRQTPGWNVTPPGERQKAFVMYATGLEWGQWMDSAARPPADVIATRSHVTLGKMIMRRKTAFHKSRKIQCHPAFWGLFMVSPYNNDDRGFYTPGALDKDTTEWLNRMQSPAYSSRETDQFEWFMSKPKSEPVEYQIYERVPRLYLDAITPPGVYLHRSNAHGRDDFLTVVSGNVPDTRKTMVACTKGVGADSAALPRMELGGGPKKAFMERFNTSTTLFPFAYPSTRETAIQDSSWSVLGFCVGMGTEAAEISATDFEHFGELYDAVKKRNALPGFEQGIVDAYACVEMSRFLRNVQRLDTNIVAVGFASSPSKPVVTLPSDCLIGFPNQVVTVAPCESSLRLCASSTANYLYNSPALELNELGVKYWSIWTGQPGELMEVWNNCVLLEDISSVQAFLQRAQMYLAALVKSSEKALKLALKEKGTGTNKRICAQYREYLKKNAKYLPLSLAAVFDSLR